MAKKHVVTAAVADGVALVVAGGVTIAMALHENDVVLSVDGETHGVSVREDTVKQVFEKGGITVDEHDVTAPSPDAKITGGMEIGALYDRQLQLTTDGEVCTMWITSRTVDDALTQLSLNDPDSELFASRSVAVGREGLSFNISTPKNATIDAAGTPVKLRVAETVGGALTAAKATPDKDDVVTSAADTSFTDDPAISCTNVGKRTIAKEEAAPLEKKEEKSDELEEGKTRVTTRGISSVKTRNFVEVYCNGTLVSSRLQDEQVTKEPVAQVTKAGTKKASKPPEGGPDSGDGGDLSPANGSPCQASYYWQGQTTASGEQFNSDDLTAAHKTLPLGSKIKVTNPSSSEAVVVRINDRGLYVAGHCLDLSKATMETAGGTSSGVITINCEVL